MIRMLNISRKEKFNNSKVSAGISIFFALTIIVSGFPPNVFIDDAAAQSSSTGNTGFEPWYYYAGGIINTANGNLYISEKDISIKARGFDIEIIRSYNSRDSVSLNQFGFGWTFNYNIKLTQNLDGSIITLIEGDGSKQTFIKEGDVYISPAGINSKLKKNIDNSFSLMHKDGSKYNFDQEGFLRNIEDKNKNHLIFTHSGGIITKIADDSGLFITINYNGGKISSIVDPIGRQISYEYDANDLSKVTDEMGNSSLYKYYDNHKLNSIIDRVDSATLFSYTGEDRIKDIMKSQYNRSNNIYTIPFILNSFKYDDANKIVDITDAMGYETSVKLNNFGNPVQIIDPLGGITAMAWDSDMNLLSSTDPNNHGHSSIFQ